MAQTPATGPAAGTVRRAPDWVAPLCWIAVLLDGFDLVVVGTVVTTLQKPEEWALSGPGTTFVITIGLVGMMIGALSIGTLTDVLGRRRALIGAVTAFSFFTLLCAFAPNAAVFGVLRFLAGVGLVGRGSLLSRLWTRPCITVTGVDVPTVARASNTLLPVVTAKLSMRIAPGDDPGRAFEALRAQVESRRRAAEGMIEELKQTITAKLVDAQVPVIQLDGRIKRLFSIHQKLRRQKIRHSSRLRPMPLRKSVY